MYKCRRGTEYRSVPPFECFFFKNQPINICVQ